MKESRRSPKAENTNIEHPITNDPAMRGDPAQSTDIRQSRAACLAAIRQSRLPKRYKEKAAFRSGNNLSNIRPRNQPHRPVRQLRKKRAAGRERSGSFNPDPKTSAARTAGRAVRNISGREKWNRNRSGFLYRRRIWTVRLPSGPRNQKRWENPVGIACGNPSLEAEYA